MNNKITSHKRDKKSAAIINFLIVFLVMCLIIFCIDAFIIHSIPAPEGAFELTENSQVKFNLFDSDLPYSNYECLDSDTSRAFVQTYLVSNDSNTHLLLFEFHFISQRGKLVGDVIVDPGQNETYHIKAFLCNYDIGVSEGKLISMDQHGFSKGVSAIYSPEIFFYCIIAAAIAFAENFVYRKVTKRKL